jgi:hypothetical protein
VSISDNFAPSNQLQVSPAVFQMLTSEFRHSSTAFIFCTVTNRRLPIICTFLVSTNFHVFSNLLPQAGSMDVAVATLVTDIRDKLRNAEPLRIPLICDVLLPLGKWLSMFRRIVLLQSSGPCTPRTEIFFFH